MLVTGNKVLRDARANHYAVPGFNCIADVMVRGILDKAEELGSPIFLMLYSVEIDEKTWWYLPGLVRSVAPHYRVPIVLHLDHATELPVIQKALDSGFTSVMYDGSNLPFEQNIERTREVVEMAKRYDVSVEAELGLVGGFDLTAKQAVSNVLTQPEEVVAFVDQTGIDSLAASIGTAHGVYTQLPTLDIPLLQRLHRASTVPLVLHGGSGTPDDQIRQAVKNGICKMNVYADSRVAMWKRYREFANESTRTDTVPREYVTQLQRALGEVVEAKSRLLGAVGKY